MAFKRLKNSVILVKNGGTPVLTDNITVSAVTQINPTIAGGDIEQVSNTLGSGRTYTDPYQKTAEFDIEMLARTNDTDASPACVELLKSCMITSETVDAGVSVDYRVDSVSLSPTTIYAYEDGEKHEISGRVRNLNVNGTIGEPLKFVFNVSGFVDQTVNEANPSVTNDNNDFFFVDKITGFTEKDQGPGTGTTVNISDFSLTMGNEIASNYNVDLTEYTITDYKPEINFSFLKIKNDLSVWDDLNNQNLKEIEIVCKTQGDTPKYLYILIENRVLKNVETGDQNSLQTMTKTYSLQNDAGDDNFFISWYETDPLA